MTDNEEINEVFRGGDILEKILIKDGYAKECVGSCSEVNTGKLERWLDFEYTENKKRPTQKYLNSITPKSFKYKLMPEELDYEDSFAIGVSIL